MRVRVVSSGQKCSAVFRLVNDVPRTDFQLELPRPDDISNVSAPYPAARTTPRQHNYDQVVELSHRINELGLKSGQVLLFLSFAMVSVATLRTVGREPTPQIPALNEALFWWKWALIPVLVGILPMKEAWWHSPSWYQVIR